ncbi:hypothetical protein LOK49_LG09G02062 [Camellia lanceoleosa]|uniref:Uncharacterized protein n=1 Tax=Camellia lanceoleosa TaxID=1840588 RepID=A0ACC0GJS4_9ERIC|nr:hypothetical protein LOK49_LG09G02062 [Camellia lanceoleosa]
MPPTTLFHVGVVSVCADSMLVRWHPPVLHPALGQELVMNHRCAKFKTKPLEHLDLMERVFAGAATTGKHVWTPTEIHDADGTSDSAATLNSGMGPLNGGTPPRDVPDCVGDNVVDCSLFDNAPPYSTVDGSANTKCCKRVAPGTVASSMDNLVEAVSKQNRKLKIT